MRSLTGVDRSAAGWVRRMWPFVRVRPGNWLLAVGAGAVAGVAGALLPLLQRQLLDRAVSSGSGSLVTPLLLLVGLGVLICLAQRVCAYRELLAANDTQYRLYASVHERMQAADGAGPASPASGQLAARLNSDIGVLARALAAVPRLAGLVLVVALTAGLMLALSPLLAAASLLTVPLTVMMLRIARRRVRPATWRAQQQEAEIAQLVSNAVAGVRVVKAFAAEEREVEGLSGASSRLYSARMRLVRLQAVFTPLTAAVPVLAQVCLVLLGGWLVLRHQISLGTFLAFGAYQGQLAATVTWVADATLNLQEAGVCAERVLELLDLPPAVPEAPEAYPLPAVRGEIRLDRVSFGYPGAAEVLNDFDLRIASGQTVALVGASGSGKSTALQMLARLHDPHEGAVHLDDVDLRAVTLDSLRRQVGVVFEEPFLFSGTLLENIVYGRPDATDAEVDTAVRTACLDETVRALPNGYRTQVGERGMLLSGGQRQRVALARALLIRPRVLLLDDTTGAVDAKLEREIHRRLHEDRDGRTTVFVGYRPSTLVTADRIVVMEAGHVVDEGSHAELLERCPVYRRLVDPRAPGGEPPLLSSGSPSPAGGVRSVAPAADPGDGAPATDKRVSVRRLVGGRLGALALAATLLALQASGAVLGPYLAREAVDRGILTGSIPGLARSAVAIAALGLCGLLLSAGTVLITGRVGQRIVQGLRIRVWAHLVRLPISFFERQKAGRLLTKMVNDIDAYSDLVSGGLVTAGVALLTLAGVLVGMTAVSAPLAGVTVAVVLPFVLILWRFNRTMTAAYRQAREQVAAANASLQENLAGIREAQAFGQQRRQHAEYTRLTRRYLDSRLSAEKLVAVAFPVTTFLSSLAVALVLGLGARMLRSGALSPGELIAFVLWVNIFFAPLLQLSIFYSDWKRVRVSTARINELMAQPAEEPVQPAAGPVAATAEPATAAGHPVRGEVRLCGVRFRYPNTAVDVLRGVDLTICPGETMAIVGSTGAGKSTLLKLLARFYPADHGRVLLDGHDVRGLDLAGYRRILGYLPQEPYLFPGTIRDNIAYGRPDASDVDVEHAARVVGAHDAISTLARGYRHEVGERGTSLSAGQRQLVCLARVYLLDPAIVLLDEATTSLDLATEAAVLSAMRTVARDRTTVMIAHRIATAMAADRIAVVDNGLVVATGTAEALLGAGGLYTELHEASFSLSRV